MGIQKPDLLHRPVSKAAERHPDKVAFRCIEAELTYADLHARASSLARALQESGVRRGDRVGLYLNKSLESAIALFATMQAGAAYVPLDPGAPTDRVCAILRHCEARAAITHEARRRDAEAAIQGSGVAAVIGLDEPLKGIAQSLTWDQALSAPPAPAVAPGASELDLAYIIFTSGSTGVPKGIMHTHASGMSYARMAAGLYGLRPEDRLSNASPLHFDMSTFDYFCAPLVGATTTIIPEPYLKLPASLAELIEAERLTIWYSVPFALTQMLHFGDLAARDLSSLRWVLYGGEPFVPKHLETLTRLLPNARFSNVYGPAEVNQCTWFNLPGVWREEDSQPPIGWMCPNADGLIVDEERREVAAGEMGELAVRTPTMMRGYWRRPELNARAFLRRPNSGQVDDVYYLTGDLAWRRPDGALMFAGRRDRQIKTRGYRVELDEVEEALAAHDAVAEAAAFATGNDDGLVLIEAAVVLRTGAVACDRDLAAFAAKLLPSYATPARLRVVDAFPRTTTGKIDRNRLADEAAERHLGGA